MPPAPCPCHHCQLLQVAASYLQDHPDAVALLDYAASAGLTRVQCPWVLGPILWEERQVKKAVCWLSRQVGLGLRAGRGGHWPPGSSHTTLPTGQVD